VVAGPWWVGVRRCTWLAWCEAPAPSVAHKERAGEVVSFEVCERHEATAVDMGFTVGSPPQEAGDDDR
jgi:hypothetical protein